MTQAHPRALRALHSLDRLTRRLAEQIDRLEVMGANGLRETRRASQKGWADSDAEIRSRCEPCFTLSAGRSGTMTLALLGRLSPELESLHEPLPNLLTESFLAHSNESGDAAFLQGVMADARDRPIRNAHRRGRIWFETNNRMTFLVPVILERYPQSRFIILARHPEKFAASAMARDYYTGHPWDFARITPRSSDADSARWPSMSQLERIGWLWRETYETALRSTHELGTDRVFTLRSEDLFSDQGDAVRSVFAFLGTTRTPSRRKIERLLGQGSNAQAPKPGSRREEWDSGEAARFIEHVKPTMERFGYEPT